MKREACMKKLTKEQIAEIIVLAAIDYIVKGEYCECYKILRDEYNLSGDEVDKILDKYDNVITQLADNYQNILFSWVLNNI
jgi:predicted nucleic acid-binding Zn finger protein